MMHLTRLRYPSDHPRGGSTPLQKSRAVYAASVVAAPAGPAGWALTSALKSARRMRTRRPILIAGNVPASIQLRIVCWFSLRIAAISATVSSSSVLIGGWAAVLSGIMPSGVGSVGAAIACGGVLPADGAGEDGGDEEVEADSLALCLLDQRDV